MSNYPLRKNNLQKVLNLENYKEMVELIMSIEDVKAVYLMEEEDRVYIYIQRYPIIRKIHTKGNMAIPKEEILSYIGFYENMPLRTQKLDKEDLEEKIRRLYMDKGFLDADVEIDLKEDEEGYAELYIIINEGPVYFTAGGVYIGSSYKPSFLDREIGIVKGRIVRESSFSELVFPLQDFYIKEGFWDSFVYYQGVEELRLNKPFYSVLAPQEKSLRESPFRLFGALFEGLSNLFNHPIGTTRAVLGRGFVARPVFQVMEGKRYRVLTEGVSFFKEEEILRLSELYKKGADPFSLEEAKENILRAYHRKGFFEAVVHYRKEGQDIVFVVEEGPRYKVFSEKIEEEFYDEDKLETFLKDKLQELFKKGYVLAEGSVKKEILKEEKKVKVYIDIELGKRHILKNFVYVGKDRELKSIFSEHREKLPAPYNTELIEALNLDIQKYFYRKGFLEGTYEIQVDIQESEDSVHYTYIYTILEGPVYRYGETIYYGHEKTSTRELSYMTERGEHYSETLDDRTLQNMLGSGIFSGVSIRTFVDRERKVVHRLIEVSEDRRGILDISVGYNTEENLSFEAFLGAKNLLGVGLISGVRYRKTGKRELYDLTLEDRVLFTRKLWLKSSLYKGHEEHRSYNLDSYGFNLQLGYRINPTTSIGPLFSLLRNRVNGQIFNLKKSGLFLIREFRDDPFLPKRLRYNSFDFSLAEGDAYYNKLTMSSSYVIPLKKRYKVSSKVELGVLWGDAPIFERFFLGGLRNLRGYSFEEIGQPDGGKYYSSGRLEFMFPLRKEPFIGAVFGDAGAVVNREKDLLRKIKWSFGYAFGVNTPIGPIRLDLAFPTEEDWYRRYKLYLSVGYYY